MPAASWHQPSLTDADSDEVCVLTELIDEVRSRPGVTGSDTIAHAVITAGYRRAGGRPPAARTRPSRVRQRAR